MTSSDQTRMIDIGQILTSKFGERKVPPLLVNLLKKILHQDYINEVISKTSDDGIAFCEESLMHLGISLDVEGLENVPADGTRYTFVSNHPLGGIDGLALCGIIGRRFGPVKMLVNDFLTFIKPISPMCIPINKVGGQSRNLPALVDKAFESDEQLLIFPAGLCSRRSGGVIKDLPWKKTFVTKSIASRRMVVPVRFEGRNSNRFYFVANLCKLLRLKFNAAMVLLPDEMYRARGNRFKVVFGKPVHFEAFDSSKSMSEWALWMQDRVYEM